VVLHKTDIGVGVPLSAPWSWRAILRPQSWGAGIDFSTAGPDGFWASSLAAKAPGRAAPAKAIKRAIWRGDMLNSLTSLRLPALEPAGCNLCITL
jgi:hypothetical protein